jgi:hypothetical protein
MDLFPSNFFQPLLRVLSFFSGTLITVLFLAGLLGDSGYLLTVEFLGGKSLAWLLSVLVSIYGICKVSIASEIHPYTAEECMEEVEKHIHYDFRDPSNSAHSWCAYSKFSDFFQHISKQLATELFSVIVNPILFLFVLPQKAAAIVDFVSKNSVRNQRLGWICKFSEFEGVSENPLDFDDESKKLTRSIMLYRKVNESLGNAESLIDLNVQRLPGGFGVTGRQWSGLVTVDHFGRGRGWNGRCNWGRWNVITDLKRIYKD